MTNTNDSLDSSLRELIDKAKEYPAKSKERRRILNQLVTKIDRSGELNAKILRKWKSHPHYEDMYRDALSRTYMEICQKIDNYHPERKVMAWVNQVLEWRFTDVLREKQKDQERMREIVNNIDVINSLRKKKDNNDIEELRKFIDNDPENILRTTCIRSNPEANLQTILQMRLNEEGWKSIAQKLGTKLSTVSGFYQDRIERQNILNYFRKYL